MGSVNVRQLALFNEHLLALTRGDLPVAEGLRRSAMETDDPRFARLCQQAASGLERGLSLSDSLARAQPAVPRVYAAMVRAGERTGNLVRPVEMLETYYRSATVLEARLRTALVYPGIILAVSMLFLPLYAFAVSQFRAVFASMNVELPAMTRLVLGFGPQWSLPFSAVVLAALAALAGSREARSLVLGWLPLLGRLLMLARTARTSRVLGMLLASEVPLPEALELAAEVSGDARAAAGLTWLSKSVSSGGTLSESFQSDGPTRGVFPLTFVWTVGMGERSGHLDRALTDMAAYYDGEVEALSRSAPVWIEMALILALGLGVMTVLAALFMPMIKIINYVG